MSNAYKVSNLKICDDIALEGDHEIIQVVCILERPEFKDLVTLVAEKNPHVKLTVFSHKDMYKESAKTAHAIVFEIRLLGAYDDFAAIRTIRGDRPLVPIVGISINQDQDFMLESFNTGVNDYVSLGITPAVLMSRISSLHKLSESSRLVEIQNHELVRSMQSEREATEKRLLAETDKTIAEAQASANSKMREILDNLKEGFFTIEKDLSINNSTSASCRIIFGSDIAGKPLGQTLNLSGDKETYLLLSFAQLFENELPIDVNLSLLPSRVTIANGKTVDLKYTPILDDSGNPIRVIIAASDVTEAVQIQNELEQKNALHSILMHILTNLDSFETFVSDCKKDLESLRQSTSLNTSRRLLHTLKGNTAACGLDIISSAIHITESDFDKHANIFGLEGANQSAAEQIEALLREFLETNYNVLKLSMEDTREETFEIKRSHIEKVMAFANQLPESERKALMGLCTTISLKPISALTTLFQPTAARLAGLRLKKVDTSITGTHLRVSHRKLSPLIRSLIHAIRNACDHGIESPDERLDAGKTENGHLNIHFDHVNNTELHIFITDDGRGIPKDGLIETGLNKGIITPAQAEQFRATNNFDVVFLNGVSTAKNVTEISGRGQGMSCIKTEVDKLNGIINIMSQIGTGTTIEISVPADVADDGFEPQDQQN